MTQEEDNSVPQTGTITNLLRELPNDPEAVYQISARVFAHIGPRIERRLQRCKVPASVSDRDDIINSTLLTLLTKMTTGQFEILNSDALWTLALEIAEGRIKDAWRRDHAQKRCSENKRLDLANSDPISREIDPAIWVEAVDLIEHLIRQLAESQSLGERLVFVAVGTMQGKSVSDIAKELKCDDRTIRRYLETIRSVLEELREKSKE